MVSERRFQIKEKYGHILFDLPVGSEPTQCVAYVLTILFKESDGYEFSEVT
jgi:hypothetical protein